MPKNRCFYCDLIYPSSGSGMNGRTKRKFPFSIFKQKERERKWLKVAFFLKHLKEFCFFLYCSLSQARPIKNAYKEAV